MPKDTKFKVSQVKIKGVPAKNSWRVNVPAKFSMSGVRERHYFRTREAALAEQKRLLDKKKIFGETASAITPTLSDQATRAAEVLAPYGITILEAAHRIAALEIELAASITIEAALDAFMAAKSDKSEKQQQAIRHLANHLRADFAGRLIASITGDEIEAHLDARTKGKSAYNSKMRIMVTLWRWCAVPKRAWCDANALKHCERKTVVTAETGTLNAQEAETLLRTAEMHFPDMVANQAVALFTGMRQIEIERLQPDDVTSEGITVPKTSNRKTNKRRFIQMTEPLAAWLERYPVTENFIPANFDRKDKALRRLSGWKVWSDLVADKGLGEAEPPEDAPLWPQNALRHTAASLNVTLGKPVEMLVFEHGHTGSLEMLKIHYVGKMTKKDAIKIWALRPMEKAAARRKEIA